MNRKKQSKRCEQSGLKQMELQIGRRALRDEIPLHVYKDFFENHSKLARKMTNDFEEICDEDKHPYLWKVLQEETLLAIQEERYTVLKSSTGDNKNVTKH